MRATENLPLTVPLAAPPLGEILKGVTRCIYRAATASGYARVMREIFKGFLKLRLLAFIPLLIIIVVLLLLTRT